ncbi:unnamed protein product [Allacma fusca]|uniref:Uncharacterized protein n=1 Tax=Allacma fusca TaxID=39272 RepID=A0A8J2JXT1_9HEXA|nr:unnamed protein product [Allacma fusca]
MKFLAIFLCVILLASVALALKGSFERGDDLAVAETRHRSKGKGSKKGHGGYNSGYGGHGGHGYNQGYDNYGYNQGGHGGYHGHY